MQFIVKNVFAFLLLFLAQSNFGQSTYLSLGSKYDQFLQRLEIKLRVNPDLNLSTDKPLSRRMIDSVLADIRRPEFTNDSTVQWFEGKPEGIGGGLKLSAVDNSNLNSFLMNNIEWYHGDVTRFKSQHPVWNALYKTPANFFEVHDKDFFLAVNPILQEQQSLEKDNTQRIFVNTRGVNVRGMIADRVGFYTYLTENLERTPVFVQNKIASTLAVPGNGRYNSYKVNGVDYSDARGGITFNAAKYIDFQFAYDKNFIGDGYRSLFLSDYSSNYLFLKVNTRIWRLNYENIFMELNPQFDALTRGTDQLLDKKYAAIHHLSVNATNWLKVGLFESVIFGRRNHFDFTYLNPIIFLRTSEKQNNSPDNGFVGVDLKANIFKTAQVYAQFLFDELKVKELTSGRGWYGNKFGIQLGAKYIDAFGVPNLDLQGEVNAVRPFTYTHYDSTDNYSHYNQPLAHPLGANFIEAIGIVKYQPLSRLTTSLRAILWKQGLDSSALSNTGADIFKLYTTRTAGDYGYRLPTGVAANGINFQLLASYELKENLFIDGSILIRNLSTANNYFAEQRTTMITAGVRLNISRREYDY